MITTLQTDRRPLTILAKVKTNGRQRIRIVARDLNKPNTVYGDRGRWINGEDVLEIKMPKSPTETQIIVYNESNPNIAKGNDDKTFKVVLEPAELKTCPMFLSEKQRSFIKFAQEFSENAGILGADYNIDGKVFPSIYGSDDGQFYIHYFDVIRDKKTGNFVGTPARIGHDSGIIEVSKRDFMKYSVPMRMVILLHEYNHKYGNPLVNRKISDESSSDILGLFMYLSLGYSEIEAHQAFLKVFRGAKNEANHKRYKIINDFIDRYSKGEINNCFIETKSVTIK